MQRHVPVPAHLQELGRASTSEYLQTSYTRTYAAASNIRPYLKLQQYRVIGQTHPFSLHRQRRKTTPVVSTSRSLLYTVDVRVKDCPSIQSVDVLRKGSTIRRIILADIRKRTIYALPHVKQLPLSVVPFEDHVCTYIMQTFPNFESIFLDFRPVSRSLFHWLIRPI